MNTYVVLCDHMLPYVTVVGLKELGESSVAECSYL